MNLSARLQAALDLIPAGASVADVCCDHAHLAIAAASTGARRAIAIDVAEEPLALARRNAGLAGVRHLVQIRRGDGLAPLLPGEVDGVVIAGVGGRTCLGILQRGELARLGLKWLVLQVNRDLPRVRSWLAAQGWSIERETLVRDGRRIFPTLIASPHHPPRALQPAEAYLGQLPRDADAALHIEHLTRRAAKLADEVAGLRSGTAAATVESGALRERQAWLTAVQQALAVRRAAAAPVGVAT